MKIIIEEPMDGEEEQIIVKCRQMTPALHRVLSLLKTQETLVAYDGNEIHRIQPSAIYYIEVVDNKTFLYCKATVYESKQSCMSWRIFSPPGIFFGYPNL